MFATPRILRFVTIGLCAIGIGACATLPVRWYVERDAEFSRYRTYTWGPAETLSTGDSRLDNNPFFHERVQADVEKGLAAKGLEKAVAGTADLLAHYHASISQRIEVNGVDRTYGYCEDEECRPYVAEAGTLTIDLVDTRTNRVIWRGWAEMALDGVIDNQARLEEMIDDAVARIVDNVPGRR